MGDFYVADFEFQAAEFGVVVFSQFVGEVDDTVLLQVHRLCSFGPVPAYGWECDGAWALRELQADMPVLNKTGEARRCARFARGRLVLRFPCRRGAGGEAR